MGAKFVGLDVFNGTKGLIINYNKPSNLLMFFNVAPHQREVYTVATSASAERICLSFHDEVNQNLTSSEKYLIFIHHLYVHANM